ncbi:MAG TPA: iron ABC transporter substrate-binding protein [Solirubrobacteraceae bacterium]|nr:iron ABC transporter substrate-binding protein [Solirubrobacteraceae bacterium]
MRLGKCSLLTALLACAGLLVSACSSSSGGDATLTLYSGQHEQTTAALVAAFHKQTGITVAVRSGDEAELADQLLQEGSNSSADLFYSENTPALEALRERGLLAPAAPSTLAAVPSRYDSAQGDWVGVSARVSVLVYDTSQLRASQLPSSILELAQPKWKGKVGFAPSETDFQPLVTAIVKLDGIATAESWLKGLEANSKLYPSNETVVAQVNNGESALAPINHYYWYRLRAELGASGMHSALHYYAAGDPGDLVDVSGAAVLKSSAHRAAAQRFLAFLVSRAGQETIAQSHSYEYPLRPGVPPALGLAPFAALHPAPLTPAQLGDGQAALALEQKLGLL